MTLANNTGLQPVADRLRKCVFEVLIGEADGEDAAIASQDNVRVKIGRSTATPLLEVQSNEETANGSICTAENPTTITLMGPDLSFPAGLYDIEVSIWDTSEEAMKKAERGVFVLRESMGGEITS